MTKLKSLRASMGTYGRVAANGIIDVDAPMAKKLLATKRFVAATKEDIAAAQDRMTEYVAKSAQGVPAGFAPIAEPLVPALNAEERAAQVKGKADAEARADATETPSAESKKAQAKADGENLASNKADAEAGAGANETPSAESKKAAK